MMRHILGLMLLSGLGTAWAEEAKIPVLTWEPRSDWMNVRDWGAIGDGVADDTAAIQAVFDRTPETDGHYAESLRRRVVYFPAGRYRLTKTLVLAKSHGAWISMTNARCLWHSWKSQWLLRVSGGVTDGP